MHSFDGKEKTLNEHEFVDSCVCGEWGKRLKSIRCLKVHMTRSHKSGGTASKNIKISAPQNIAKETGEDQETSIAEISQANTTPVTTEVTKGKGNFTETKREILLSLEQAYIDRGELFTNVQLREILGRSSNCIGKQEIVGFEHQSLLLYNRRRLTIIRV